MTKRAGILFVLCCFFIAALPSAVPAARPQSRQVLVQNSMAGLQDRLLSIAPDDRIPLHGLTAQFLDDLGRVGFTGSRTDLDLSVMQYVFDAQDQTAAAALNSECYPALMNSVILHGSNMMQELVSYDPPLCEALSLSASAAGIISAKYDYDICVENTKDVPDELVIQDIEGKQNNIKIYSFTTDVLSLMLCSATITSQDIIGLLVRFITLFM